MFSALSLFIFALILIPLIAALPAISISVPGVMNGPVYAYIRAAAYFLPMSTIAGLLTITFGLYVFRMLITLILTVKQIFFH